MSDSMGGFTAPRSYIPLSALGTVPSSALTPTWGKETEMEFALIARCGFVHKYCKGPLVFRSLPCPMLKTRFISPKVI